MDPYNLAICFGPTLVPIPEDREQVQFQHLVNELIKNFIIFHEDIFPTSVPGSVYEKYLTQEPEDMGDLPDDAGDQTHDDEIDSEFTEDDSVFKEDNDKEDDLQDFSLDLFGSKKLEILKIFFAFLPFSFLQSQIRWSPKHCMISVHVLPAKSIFTRETPLCFSSRSPMTGGRARCVAKKDLSPISTSCSK